jgi:hypothetical protein
MRQTFKTILLASAALAIASTSATAAPWGREDTSMRILWQLNGMEDTNRDAINNSRDAINDMNSDIGTKLDDLNRTLIEAMRLSTGESSSYADKQIEADRRFQDAAQQNDTQRQRQQFRAEAESGKFDPAPNSCLLSGLFAGNGETGPQPGEPGQGSRSGANVMADMSGQDPAVQEGGVVLARDVVDSIEPFAGRSDGTTDINILFENATLDLNDEDTKRVVERNMRNLINPLPPKPLTAAELMRPEGVARAAVRQGTAQRNSTALSPIIMANNMREAVISSESYLPLIEDSAYNRSVPELISELQSIDIRTVYHYAKKKAAADERTGMTSKQLLENILDVMSIQTRISYLQLEMQTRDAAVNAAILATMNN